MNLDTLYNGFHLIEDEQYRVEIIYLSSKHYKELKNISHDSIDYNYDHKTLSQGLVGFIWGAEIRVSKDVKQAKICSHSHNNSNLEFIFSGEEWISPIEITKEKLLKAHPLNKFKFITQTL